MSTEHTLFEIFKEMEHKGASLENIGYVEKYLQENYEVDETVYANLSMMVVMYKSGVNFEEHSDDSSIALMLALNWANNLSLIEPYMRTPGVFVGYCARMLREGGIDFNDPEKEERVFEIIQLALDRMYDGKDLDEILYGGGEVMVAKKLSCIKESLDSVRKRIKLFVDKTGGKIGFLEDYISGFRNDLIKLNMVVDYLTETEREEIITGVMHNLDRIERTLTSMEKSEYWKELGMMKEFKENLGDEFHKLSDDLKRWMVKKAVDLKKYLRRSSKDMKNKFEKYSDKVGKENHINVINNMPYIDVHASGLYREALYKFLAKFYNESSVVDGDLKIRSTNYEDIAEVRALINRFARKEGMTVSGDDYSGYVLLARGQVDFVGKYSTEMITASKAMKAAGIATIDISEIKFEDGRLYFGNGEERCSAYIGRYLEKYNKQDVTALFDSFSGIIDTAFVGIDEKKAFEKMSMDHLKVMFSNLGENVVLSFIDDTVMATNVCVIDPDNDVLYHSSLNREGNLIPVKAEIFNDMKTSSVIDFKVGESVLYNKNIIGRVHNVTEDGIVIYSGQEFITVDNVEDLEKF